MTVTDIKDYKKGRYEIYLNDEAAFVLYKSELKTYGIKTGQELSEDTISEITSNVLVKRAKKRAMNLLMKNDMTESKLRSKLITGGYSEQIANEAVNYVKGYHYIDDRRYAMSFINSKSSSDSKATIRRKLIERGVSKDLIDSCLEEYYVEDDLNAGAERELIKKQVIKKIRNLKSIVEPAEGEGDTSVSISYEERQKIIASLMRKGFTYYDIEAVLGTLE